MSDVVLNVGEKITQKIIDYKLFSLKCENNVSKSVSCFIITVILFYVNTRFV